MKWVIRIAVLIAIVIAALLWLGYSQLGGIIKFAIEKGGAQALKVPVKVHDVKLSVFGKGSVEGLELGNPEGFVGPQSLRIGKAELALDTSSLQGDKVIIRHIHIMAPEVHLEAALGGTNLGKIAQNARQAAKMIESASGSRPAPEAPAGGSDSAPHSAKLQIDEVLVTGARLHASAGILPGAAAEVILPDIKIKGLGTGPDGISPAALTAEVLSRITEEAAKAGAGGSLKDLLKGGDVKLNTDGIKKGIEGLGKLLK